MDSSKREVSWLESFLPDIWAYIAWYLMGEQLGRLMMTGATSLRQRLTSPGVVKSIILGEDLMLFKSAPKLLHEFQSLAALSIRIPRDERSPTSNLKIDLMPSGVRKFELRSRYWGSCLRCALFGENGSTLKLNEHLPCLEILDLSWVEQSSFSWMAYAPPSLTNLSLYNWDGTVELPSSLIYFEARIVPISMSTSAFVSKLPPSLETFEVRSWCKQVDLLAHLLPSSIRQLSLGKWSTYADGLRSTCNLLERLPKSLTRFRVPEVTGINFQANPDSISLLPSTLTELRITAGFPCSVWHLLPENLTTLHFDSIEPLCPLVTTLVDDDGVNHEVPYLPFQSLPRSITKLRFTSAPLEDEYFCGPPINSNRSFFPPQLTYLAIPKLQLSPEAATLLPSSLTHLRIGNLCERVCKHLPNSLKTLIADRTLMSTDLIKFLPRSLTSLQLSVFYEGDWFDYKTAQRIDCNHYIPLYKNQESNIDWKAYPLPPTITSLVFIDTCYLGDSFSFDGQLQNLLELDLADSGYFTDLSIEFLSRHLTTLDLHSSTRVSGKSFRFLPSSLTVLNLGSSQSIFDPDIQHLPRTLKKVLFDSAIYLTELCISYLPPRLEEISMRSNTNIPLSSFPNFPCSLRSSATDTSVRLANWHTHYGVVYSQR